MRQASIYVGHGLSTTGRSDFDPLKSHIENNKEINKKNEKKKAGNATAGFGMSVTHGSCFSILEFSATDTVKKVKHITFCCSPVG